MKIVILAMDCLEYELVVKYRLKYLMQKKCAGILMSVITMSRRSGIYLQQPSRQASLQEKL